MVRQPPQRGNGGPLVHLNGVTAVPSSTDVWAVGGYFPTSHFGEQPLLVQCAGNSCIIVSGPDAGPGLNELSGVAAVSDNNIWAVGVSYANASPTSTGPGQPLVDYYNGSWHIGSSSPLGPRGGILYGVAANPAGDVWAVGGYFPTSAQLEQPLLEHCAGSSCTMVSLLNQGLGDRTLYGVAENSAGRAWAVGKAYDSSISRYETLIEYYDGSTWKVVSSQNTGMGDNVLYGVATDPSSTDVWAVGIYAPTPGGTRQSLIEGNHKGWGIVTSQNFGTGQNLFVGVAVASDDSKAWAVGAWNPSPTSPEKTNAALWDGHTWIGATFPNQGSYDNALSSIAVVSATNQWAVGDYASTSGVSPTQSLVMEYS